MFCTRCGKELKEEDKFCGQCGMPQTGVSTNIHLSRVIKIDPIKIVKAINKWITLLMAIALVLWMYIPTAVKEVVLFAIDDFTFGEYVGFWALAIICPLILSCIMAFLNRNWMCVFSSAAAFFVMFCLTTDWRRPEVEAYQFHKVGHVYDVLGIGALCLLGVNLLSALIVVYLKDRPVRNRTV